MLIRDDLGESPAMRLVNSRLSEFKRRRRQLMGMMGGQRGHTPTSGSGAIAMCITGSGRTAIFYYLTGFCRNRRR